MNKAFNPCHVKNAIRPADVSFVVIEIRSVDCVRKNKLKVN